MCQVLIKTPLPRLNYELSYTTFAGEISVTSHRPPEILDSVVLLCKGQQANILLFSVDVENFTIPIRSLTFVDSLFLKFNYKDEVIVLFYKFYSKMK